MQFTLNQRQNSRKPHLHTCPESEEIGLIDALNREQTGKIVVSALYHRNSLTLGSGDATLVSS
jgi:hypothetical protein